MPVIAKNIETSFGQPSVRIALAVLCGLLAAGLLYYREQEYMLQRSGGERRPIVIAKVAIPDGDRAEEASLDIQEVPQAFIHPNAIPAADMEKVVGRKVHHEIKAAQPLLWTDFESPYNEHAAAATPKGYRAAPVQIGEVLSKSRLLSPGDYVDVIANFNLNERGNVTTTLLQRINVLELGEGAAVLQVTPEQAEKLAFAAEHGTLRFVIRNREDNEQKNLQSTTLQNLLTNISLSERPVVQGTSSVRDPKDLLKQVFDTNSVEGKKHR